ncbi:MAG TPA: SDR family NAD(P)-dependent oxidoreductase [Baekduia sp.]|uniref:SDR family NAD(P)-dependent oxidoreductase n=1 Tax=Baekduia sp. TaxID=2600305 RepID=UPI002C53231C|nr:SDR family NAD(P)-dependent oxidoreductase [Baekduia sp.]HMJ34772.1 SDR family NAD(P)-dependent oxidoreductase [Baekduia sp.]
MGGPSKIFRAGLLAGHAAVVTGGGTNLGRQAAAELLACGAQVVIAGRREDVLAAAADELGDGCSWVSGDIREAADAERIVATVLERHGRLDVLVNNAGGQYFVPAEAIAAKGWRAVMRLNVEGTMTMTTAAADALRAGGGGTVVNVTVSPHHGMPAMAHTGAARAAVEALTRELALRWREHGVSVVAAAIGRFDTESLRKYPEVVWRGAARSVPLQRLGSMDEFAWLVAMLASPLGRSLSGTTVTLDGAADNWWGAWPPPAIADDAGTVPTEARKAAPGG